MIVLPTLVLVVTIRPRLWVAAMRGVGRATCFEATVDRGDNSDFAATRFATAGLDNGAVLFIGALVVAKTGAAVTVRADTPSSIAVARERRLFIKILL